MAFQRLCLTAVFALLAIPAAAQGAAGTWKATVDSPNFGPIPTVFEFIVEGNKLRGTFSNSLIPTTPIHDGFVKGNQVSFKVRLVCACLATSGTLKGNELALTSAVVEGPPLDGAPKEMKYTVKRHK